MLSIRANKLSVSAGSPVTSDPRVNLIGWKVASEL